ncbi:MAG TPA: NADH:ubiquinone oxidoreductase subunit NDUFA12 [Rhodospirillales bacterium]|nr:NADH:ubiquinone oxidoreductase subunit NDUFA12 [Rhodospirillales bacterium]
MKTGTILYTLLKGDLVGKDGFGNRYYRGAGAKLHGRERRWVIYKGKAEASKVPPEWRAWLHHTSPEPLPGPLNESADQVKPWRKEHLPNLSGAAGAYMPSGHDLRGGARAASSGDYQSWKPQSLKPEQAPQ